MGNRILRNTVSALVVIVMIMSVFTMPNFFGNDIDNTYAAAKENNLKDVAIASAEKMLNSENGNRLKPNSTLVSKPGNTVKLATTSIKTNIAFRVYTTSEGYPAEEVSGNNFYVASLFVISKNGQANITTELTEKSLANQYIDLKTKYAGTNKLDVYYVEMYYDTVTKKYVSTDNYDIRSITFNAQGKISFNKNKGKFKTSSASKWATVGAKYGTLPKMKTRKGYSFAGWYTAKSAGKKVTSGSKVSIVKDTTLYAQWKYKITLNANKGKISGKKTNKKTVTSGKKYGSLKTPKRSGYNFAGWYTKKSGGKWINKSTYNTNASKHTLYAHWVKKSSYATKSQYKAVKKGMTYSEVKRIFGRSGTYSAAYSGDGYKNYVWLAKGNNSGAVILFINGKVYEKAWA